MHWSIRLSWGASISARSAHEVHKKLADHPPVSRYLILTVSNYFYLWQVTHLQMLNLLNDLSVPSCHGKQKYVHCITYFVLWMRFFYTNNKLWSSEEMSPNLRLVSDKYFTMALSSQHSARFNCLSGVLLSFVVPILSCGIFLFWKI